MKIFFRSVLVAGALSLCLALSGCSNNQNQSKAKKPGAAPATVKLPAVPTLPDNVFLTVVTGNLPGAIDNATDVATQVDKEFQPTMLKALLGGPFGDPQLKGFPKGSGMAIVLPSSGDRLMILSVAPAMMDSYRKGAEGQGLKTAEVDGFLLAAANPDSLDVGKELLKTDFKQRLRSEEKSTVEVTVNVARILDKYKDQIDSAIGSLASMMQMMQAAGQKSQDASGELAKIRAQVVEAEFRLLVSLGRQVKILHTVVDFGKKGIRFDNAVAPVAGSNLATFLAAPAPPFPEDVFHFLPAKGAFRGAVSYNKKAVKTFMEKEAADLKTQMKSDAKVVDAFVALMDKSMASWGDTFAMEMMLPGQPLMSGAFLSRVDDPQGALAYCETVGKAFQQGGIADFYKSIGQTMTVSFKKNVREHAGVPIHQLKFDVTLTNLPGNAQKEMQRLMGPMGYDIAVVGHVMIYAMSGVSIDNLIDVVKSGAANPGFKPLEAQQVFGAGAQGYVDFGVSGAVHMMLGVMTSTLPPGASNPFAGMETLFDGVAPITSAVYLRPDALRVNFMIPGQLLSKTGEAVREMQKKSQGAKSGSGQ